MIQFLKTFCAFYLACFACLALQAQLSLSPVIASAVVGLMGSFIPPLSAIIYIGSFAGMCAPVHLGNPYHILAISFFGTGIYLVTKNRFVGLGGKMGAIALASSLCLIWGKNLW
jgi:hypothetical protein